MTRSARVSKLLLSVIITLTFCFPAAAQFKWNVFTSNFDLVGSSAGSVTSVVIAGTANQITASGTCTVTTSGTCTLSIPSVFTLPGTLNKITFTAPTTAGTINFASDNSTASLPNGTVTKTVASGTSALGTSAIASTACATVVTTSATGTLTTDAIIVTPNASIKALTGYAPVTIGGLYISVYPTADNINIDVCNPTSSSITPSALTLNWRVVR